MLLTHKVKISLTEEQVKVLELMSNEARVLYNHFLEQKIKYYEETKTSLSYFTQQKELKDYKTQYLIFDTKKEVLRALDFNYRSYFALLKNNKDKNPQLPRFRSEKYFFTLSFVESFIIKNNQVHVSLLNKGRVIIDLPYTTPVEGLICLRGKSPQSQIKQLKIYKVKGEFYTSITYEKQPLVGNAVNTISIDLGKKNLASIYNLQTKEGTVYSSKFLSQNQKHIDSRVDSLKSLRDKKVKYSRKYKKLNNKIAKFYAKKKQQTSLALHKLSKDIVNQNADIVIGELTNLKQNTITPYKKVNRQMQGNWSLMTFVNLLEYKQILKGNKLIKVNEAWTSKTCCNCGNIDHGLTLNDREYNCSVCSNKVNRDLNGAINIMKIFMGDYDTPLELLNSSERFSWAKV